MAASALLVSGDIASARRHSLAPEENEILIGRDARCQICLTETTVSRRHARLQRRADGHYLEDLGSTGGTSINGQCIDAPQRLEDGDVIGVGGYSLTYTTAGGVESIGVSPEEVILGVRDSSGTTEHGLIGAMPERKLAAILGLARALGGGLGLEEVLENVLELLFHVFPQAERGLLLLDGLDGPRPAAARTRNGCERGLTVSRTVYEHVSSGGKAILVQDVEVDERFSRSRSVDEARIRTVMAAPLRDHANRVVGLVQLDTGVPRAGFVAADLDLLAAIAVHVGLAVDNARLLDASKLEARRLKLLAAAGEALAASLDLDATLSSLARLAVLMLADLCVVDILDEDGGIRRVAAAHADPALQPLADRLLDYPPDLSGEHPAMRALREGRTVMASDPGGIESTAVARDRDHLKLTLRLGCKSFLCIPMVARGRTLGVITLAGTRSTREYEAADLALAEELARRAATAADNARLYAEAERARRCAEDASRAKDRLLATLSHELRTPLTPVLLTLSALLDDPETPEALREHLEAGRRGIELEARLIDDLLDATRAGSGKLRLERRTIDAHKAVREALATCSDDIRSAGLRVELDLRARRSFLEADPARVQQIVWNLLRNAAKFTPRGGVITISSRDAEACASREADGPHLVIEVADTGAGIDGALLAAIFEPFEQGDAARGERSGGLGLGLTIARGIAEAHGGRLTATSAGAGRGSTFRLELPAGLLTPQSVRSQRPSLADRTEEGGGNSSSPRRILLVEDDGPTRSVLSRLLILGGNLVVTATNLAEARAAVEREAFEVVISDLDLPDGSGLDLGRWLAGGVGVPAIALSGFGSEEDKNRSREAGFSVHLTKPIGFRALEETIRRISPVTTSES